MSRFSKVSHSLGQASTFKYERIISDKMARVTQEKPDLRTPAKSLCQSVDFATERSQSAPRRAHSFEATQRLLGTTAYRMPNRHSRQQVEVEVNKLKKPKDPET